MSASLADAAGKRTGVSAPHEISGFVTCCALAGAGSKQGLFRHHDPGDDVRDETDAGHDRRDQPDHPDHRDVDVEVFGEAEAHAGNFASQARAHQLDPASEAPTRMPQ